MLLFIGFPFRSSDWHFDAFESLGIGYGSIYITRVHELADILTNRESHVTHTQTLTQTTHHIG